MLETTKVDPSCITRLHHSTTNFKFLLFMQFLDIDVSELVIKNAETDQYSGLSMVKACTWRYKPQLSNTFSHDEYSLTHESAAV